MTAELTVGDIAARVGGLVEGDERRPVTGLAAIQDAGAGDLTMVLDEERAGWLVESPAAAVLAPLDLALSDPRASVVRVENPRLALAAIAHLFAPEDVPHPGIAATADVHADAVLGEGVCVGPYAVIGPHAVIGDETYIGALTLVASGATIGRDCRIGPSCTIGSSVRLGDRVRLLAGVRLGTDGFGYAAGPDGLVRMPQVGRCVIGDDVDIGANTTVDRGALGDTVIRSGTKIDNQVQVAHNVRIGRNCIVAGHSGIAGSSQLGDNVMLGGAVGISDHVTIGDGARVGARSGVSKDIPPGASYFGYPARPQGEAMRAAAALLRLPQLMKRVKALETAFHDRNE